MLSTHHCIETFAINQEVAVYNLNSMRTHTINRIPTSIIEWGEIVVEHLIAGCRASQQMCITRDYIIK
jgi:hypothetical protein